MKKDMMKPENKKGKLYEFESIEKWHEEFKKDHPFSHWFDASVFKGKSFFGCAPHHSFFRPWIAVEYCYREIRWAWQRVFRGWDDRVTWGIDSYLAEILPQWIAMLKKYKQGIPFDMFPEEYLMQNDVDKKIEKEASEKFDAILDKISLGFKSYMTLTNLDYDFKNKDKKEEKALTQNFDEGFDLFKKHFGSLWD